MLTVAAAVVLCVGVVLAPVRHSQAADAAGLEHFEAKIRPVLVKHCYACHSAAAQSQNKLKGGLFLDTRKGTLAGGDSGPAVTPGKVDESLIIGALTHDDFEMPPAGKLPQTVIDDFKKWVERGAPDPRTGGPAPDKQSIDFAAAGQFWSFQPPQQVKPPATKDNAWPRTDIDRFVLARLEKEGLRPAAQASRRVLLRRATFDLIGLPPEPQQMQQFLEDKSPQAFAKAVDRLLNSPHYGERWGRHWLDVARYAEDQAHTFSVKKRDYAHEYRDWVIAALNNDMPYDRFVKLQLAGDLMDEEDAPPRQRLAGLGILGLGAIYYKNSDKAKALADELDDRIDTVTRGFLGLTVSCARCHDHKYDPIPTEDYYSLAGIFHNTRMVDKPLASQAVVDTYRQAQQVLKTRENELKDYRTQRKSELAEQQRNNVAQYMTAVWSYRQHKATDGKYDLGKHAAQLKLNRRWLDRWNKYLDPKNKKTEKVESLQTWRKLQPDTKKPAGKPSAELLLTAPPEVASAAAEFQKHLEFCLDQRDGELSVAKGRALYTSGKVDRQRPLVDIRVDLKGGSQLFLVVTDAGDGDNTDWADWLEPKFTGPAGEKSLLDLNWKSATTSHHKVHKNLNSAGKPLRVNGKSYERGIGTHSLSVIVYDVPAGYTHFVAKGGLDGSGVGSVEFRVYNIAPSDIKPQDNSPAQKAQTELIKTVFAENGLFGLSDKELAESLTQQQTADVNRLTAAVETARKLSPPQPPMAHVVQDTGQQNLKVYLRGNPARQGDVAPRRFLRILAGEDRQPYQQGSGRLALANDIASADNPLTARVIVNRVWQHHFGRGLVGTASNFGNLGDRPTHPQLLDWLTLQFLESGWSLKKLHRQIMLSKVYQLSSELDPAAMKKDPENRLRWRMSRRRLEVEAWRDSLLAVSGSLDTTMGGPTAKLDDTNNRRRTVYGAISRHDLDGLLRLFDFPDANVTSAARTQTTVPQQQLFVLNSDFFIKQAKALAARVQKEAGDDQQAQIQRAYQLLYCRNADSSELALAKSFLAQEKQPGDRLTKWEQYAQALLGANEFLYID